MPICSKEVFCKLLLDRYRQGKVSPEVMRAYIKQHCINYVDCKADCPVRIELDKLELFGVNKEQLKINPENTIKTPAVLD
jgi:hypothetical protein